MTIATINPATGKTLRTFDPITDVDLERRLAAAADAFQHWRRKPLAQRAAVVARAGELLAADRERYARLIRPKWASCDRRTGGGRQVRQRVPFFFRARGRIRRRRAGGTGWPPGALAGEVRFQPIGAVLAVMPWNFPFWQVIRFAAPALCAGNVGLLKHASNVPQCALALEELFLEAGAPRGVFQTLLLESARVGRVIADDRVAAVTLTGSEGAGRSVAAIAGQHLKKTVLELGGSNAFIVMPSADLERTVQTAVTARVINNGQSCIAAKRFIVAASIADAFTARFAERLSSLRLGDPMEPATQLGPLATPEIARDLAGQVERSVKAGARALGTGGLIEGPGSFFGGLVLADIPVEAPAAREELFGPVGSVFRARDADDAVRIANDSHFGLGASVWTNNAAEAEHFAEALEAGQVFINAIVASDPRYPFGGVKRSGYGRELSRFGLREFTNIKTIRRPGPHTSI